MVGENMTSFKTLKQMSRKCTSTTSVEPPWNSNNNSVVRFFFPFLTTDIIIQFGPSRQDFELHMARLTGERGLDPVPITACLIMSSFISLIPFFPSFFFPPFALSLLPSFFPFSFFFPPFTHPPRSAGNPLQNRWFGRTTWTTCWTPLIFCIISRNFL